ncbi:MAG: pseudouridine synthase [Chitinophagales bacterium]|nr:rRNA pseudouridine synthase [Bacteroidota bacterium]MCB9043970.1 rRNA pseudouridine synthase [Chitinophagales bacterium]
MKTPNPRKKKTNADPKLSKQKPSANKPQPKKEQKSSTPFYLDEKGESRFSVKRKEHYKQKEVEKKDKFLKDDAKQTASTKKPAETEEIRLNKYISNTGFCARRKADELIAQGKVNVNGKTITEMGFKVRTSDKISINGKLLTPTKKVYILLNKAKNVLSTTNDPNGRKTVLECLNGVNTEGLFPVGRLDRNTTGLIIITNDGELANRLMHPRHEVRKLYFVELNRNLEPEDLQQIRRGVQLEEGIAKVDEIEYVLNGTPNMVGVRIHIGWNRVIRRIFESLNYQVEKLDRAVYANLTKKGIARGKWRYLSPQEVISLKHFNIK